MKSRREGQCVAALVKGLDRRKDRRDKGTTSHSEAGLLLREHRSAALVGPVPRNGSQAAVVFMTQGGQVE